MTFEKNYTVNKQIGTGSFSNVYSGNHIMSGLPVAIKIIKKESNGPDIRDYVTREVEIWKRLKHQNIYTWYDYFEENDAYYIISELANTSLLAYIKKNGKLPLNETIRIFTQICLAIQYMHINDIVHRDIKCENILLMTKKPDIRQLELEKKELHDMEVKVADFGLATDMYMDTDYCVGSLHYLSPEEIRQEDFRSPTSDVWAMGCVLYAMLTGRLPFDDEFQPRLEYAIINGKYNTHDIPNEFKGLVEGILCVDTHKRMSLEQILKHLLEIIETI